MSDERTPVKHTEYPHHAGYLFGCQACEATCHCTSDRDECVHPGDHQENAAP